MTPVDKERIVALKATGKKNAEIAEIVGRSETAVYHFLKREQAVRDIVAGTPKILEERLVTPLAADSKTFANIQTQVAAQSLQAAHDLVRSIRAMTLEDLMKVPVHQRAIAAGILLDKFRLLTDQSTDNIFAKTQSVIQLIANSTPKRKKDSVE
jgi:predicted transcriptional regulator